MSIEQSWVPEACTLPSVEQPLRVAEFDALFAVHLHTAHRVSDTRLRLILDPSAEDRARDLTARETACCSFFTFTVTEAGSELLVDVAVPAGQVEVLDALAARAQTRRGAAG
ncbi:MAG: hypothetical protein DLM59_03755 [Pseudonocardiales bacterium]|nr:MAG: hypothetical protein DLM59_03755 [Pseudonocardiales bacterium]